MSYGLEDALYVLSPSVMGFKPHKPCDLRIFPDEFNAGCPRLTTNGLMPISVKSKNDIECHLLEQCLGTDLSKLGLSGSIASPPFGSLVLPPYWWYFRVKPDPDGKDKNQASI